MAVSLPTAADVRKVREQAAKTAAERAEVAKTPLLAVLGAGDRAVASVTKAAADARTRAEKQADTVQHRLMDLPAELDGLRARLTGDELRKAVDGLRAQVRNYYAELARHGEVTWDKLRRQPQVEQALSALETYGDKLDTRVDGLVDDAHDAAEKALATVTKQTRSTGETVAAATERAADEVADKVTEVSADVSEVVADAGTDAAVAIDEAGDDAARAARSTARRTANRTAPKVTPKTAPRNGAATRKPATGADTSD
jgi:heparin binding hemagglutinin HbhA